MESKDITPDLFRIAQGVGAVVPGNVRVSWVDDVHGKAALRVQPTKQEFAIEDEWVVVLEGVTFGNGVIEFEALGQSGPPQSNFLGVAFRLVDEVKHDAVYFRPFNFRAEDAERRSHAVQYISHPNYRWFDLRTNKPDEYEQPLNPAPDGDSWFRARIVIERPSVKVFVNGAQEPSLSVSELSERSGGGIGLWVGPGQGGYFANLRIVPAE